MTCSVCRTEIHPDTSRVIIGESSYHKFAEDCYRAGRAEGRLCGLEEALAIAFAEPGSLSAFDKIRAHLRKLKEGES